MDDWSRDRATEHADDSFADKISREASLLGAGLLGVKDAAVRSVDENHYQQTLVTAGASAAIGLGLAYLGRGRGLGYIATRGIGSAAGALLVKDAFQLGGETTRAIGSAWNSDDSFENDREAIRRNVGQLAFDLALASSAGMAGAAAGNRLFRPRIPDSFLSQFNHKTGITEDYYNAFGANEMRMRMLTGKDSGLPPEIVSQWRAELPKSIRNTESYSQYWDRQIATHLKYHAGEQLDSRGIHNALYHRYPNAKRLDALVADLRTFGDKDLTDPEVIRQLSLKFQQVRAVIYGAENTQQTRAVF